MNDKALDRISRLLDEIAEVRLLVKEQARTRALNSEEGKVLWHQANSALISARARMFCTANEVRLLVRSARNPAHVREEHKVIARHYVADLNVWQRLSVVLWGNV